MTEKKGPLAKLAGLLRLDGWENALTGLGVYGRDKSMSHTPGGVVPLANELLEALYNGEGIPARLIDLPVDHAMRKGWRHVPPTDLERAEEIATELDTEWRRLDCWGRLSTGWKWGRLYGGGALLMGLDDGAPMESPLDVDRVQALWYLIDLDVRDYQPATFYADEQSEHYGEPETYRLTAQIGQVSITTTVHESRLLRFGGAMTSRRRRADLGYHDYSVLQKVYDALRRFDSDWQSASAMMADASVGILKIPGFLDIVAGGSKDTFATRCSLINLGLASSRIMPLDSEESFERVERTFTGVADMLDKTTLYLAACFGWPITVLFGRSPAGMDATGESDQDNWNAYVDAERQRVLVPRAEQLQAIVLRTLGYDPEGWSIELPALSEESATDAAMRRKLIADTDAVYLQAEVFTPEEVALVRVQDGEWTDYAPEMSEEAREARTALLEQDYDRMSDGPPEEESGAVPPALGGPMPPAMIAQQEAAKAAAGAAPEAPDDDEPPEEV